jgi:uncharacterized glyoxalase superfamily protein PhnB
MPREDKVREDRAGASRTREIDPRVGATDWHFLTPQLPVLDVRETQAYYRDVLGFKIAWIWREEYGAVYNGRTEIFFTRTEGPISPCWSFARVENADAVLDLYRERGATIVEEIASHPWGMREFTIEDNNGHRFRIGHSEGPVVP